MVRFSRLGKLYCAESRRDEVWQSRRVGLQCVLLSSGRCGNISLVFQVGVCPVRAGGSRLGAICNGQVRYGRQGMIVCG